MPQVEAWSSHFHAIFENLGWIIVDIVTFKLATWLWQLAQRFFFCSIKTLFQKRFYALPRTGPHPCPASQSWASAEAAAVTWLPYLLWSSRVWCSHKNYASEAQLCYQKALNKSLQMGKRKIQLPSFVCAVLPLINSSWSCWTLSNGHKTARLMSRTVWAPSYAFQNQFQADLNSKHQVFKLIVGLAV